MSQRFKNILSKPTLYQALAAIMFCGVAIAYLNLRFIDRISWHDTSALIELSGVLFILFMACTAVSVKCLMTLKQVVSSVSHSNDGLSDAKNQQAAFMRLSHSKHLVKGLLSDAAREVTESLSKTLCVERASVWLLDERSEEIRCLDQYRLSSASHTTAESIRIQDSPKYFEMLNQARTISRSDALSDELTDEIRDEYLIPLDIHSIIDSSIRISGKVVGYMFVGSVGTKRVWNTHEVNFVAMCADLFAQNIANDEKRKTFKTLKANKALLNATLDSTADGLLVADKNGAVSLTNKRFGELWRIPKDLIELGDDEKFLNHVLDQLSDPDQFLKKVRELYNSNREDFDVLFFKDGRTFERYSCPLLLDGVMSGRVWSFRDITAKERALDSLQESEKRYHSIFDSTNDGLIILDKSGKLKEANRAVCRMHGWSEEEFLQLEPHQFIHKDSLPLFKEFLECLSRGEEYQCVARDICKDGARIDVEVSGVRLEIGGEVHFLGVIRDITERKRRERQSDEMQGKLERAERMHSIGTLAGGVAHDLNNILGPLVAYPELILMKLPEDSPLRERIGLIGKSARHAADVIQDLLTLARRGRVELQPKSMNAMVNDVIQSTNFVDLERSHPRVKLKTKLASELSSINASKTHLTKAILNLCANAFTAMPDGGELTIETTQLYIERLYSGYSALQPGNYVGLKICDTGKGMSVEHLTRLFEPYYNKQDTVTNSSGLGLAIVYSIIKDHGGYYDVISESGQGTEIILYFPVISEVREAQYTKPSSYRGAETALVVDDDENQRELACDLLESLGYQTLSAPNGRVGIELLKNRSVDVVTLDMIMDDDFDGLDTYREILKINPNQKVVIVTGFALTERVDEMRRLGAGSYVKKPYTRDSIGKAIRETLDKVAPATIVNS